MIGPMFEGWGEFYLMAGSAAAVLIGLIFVVVTLMHDRPRSSVLSGSARLHGAGGAAGQLRAGPERGGARRRGYARRDGIGLGRDRRLRA